MSDSIQTQSYGASLEGATQSTQTTSVVGRKNSTGTRFADIFMRLLGRGRKRPVAYVRSGKEVSFEKIPFVDSDGSNLKIAKGTDGKTVVTRKGRLGANSKTVDAVLRREQALSGNQGVSRAIPKFRSRAYQHLKDTEELRNGIMSGELETPGNRSARLMKKIKSEQAEDGIAVDAAWLEQVKQHLNRTKSGGAANLKAAAAALKGEAAEGKTEELADPRQPRVKKFAPQRVNADEAEHVIGKRNSQKAASAKVAAANSETADLAKAAKAKRDQVANNDREVIQRISIQKEKSVAAPGEAESRSLQIVRQLKKGANGASSIAVEEEEKKGIVQKAADPRKSVTDMKAKGWRIHTPINQRAQQEADASSGDAMRGGRRAAEAQNVNVDMASGGGRQSKKEQDESSKPSDLARLSATNGTSSLKAGKSGTNGAQQTTSSQSSSSMQEPSKGLQNLDQLLIRMETSARVLTGNGQTTLNVRLRPPELGALSVRIRQTNGKYEVSMDAENEKAAKAIEKQIPLIREHLNSRGIHVDQIQVRQGGQQDTSDFANTFENQGDNEQPLRKGRPRGRSEAGIESGDAQLSASQEGMRLKLGTNTMEAVG